VANFPSLGRSRLSIRRGRPRSAVWFTSIAVFLVSDVRYWIPGRRHYEHTLLARWIATSANPLSTSHGATRPEAGSSPLSSSSRSDESALVTLEEGACLLAPDERFLGR
jgi:hypothetical protein